MLKKDENYKMGTALKVLGGCFLAISFVAGIYFLSNLWAEISFGYGFLAMILCLFAGIVLLLLCCVLGGTLETLCKVNKNLEEIKDKYLNLEENTNQVSEDNEKS